MCFRESGCGPFAVSILTDYFTPETRGFALGIYNWGIYFGYSMSYAFGNFVSLANINGQVSFGMVDRQIREKKYLRYRMTV